MFSNAIEIPMAQLEFTARLIFLRSWIKFNITAAKNTVISPNFHTRKLGKITLFFVMYRKLLRLSIANYKEMANFHIVGIYMEF